MGKKWTERRKERRDSRRSEQLLYPVEAQPEPSMRWAAADEAERAGTGPEPAAAPTPPGAPTGPEAAAPVPPEPAPVPPEPVPVPPATPTAVAMGQRVAESIGAWLALVTALVDQVDRTAAEQVGRLEAVAAHRHRELSDAVTHARSALDRQAADCASALERQATELLAGVEERFRAIAQECASTVAVAEQAAEAWRVTVDNAGTAKQSELDATMAKHRVGIEDMMHRTRQDLENAVAAQISRLQSQVAALKEDLRREVSDQTLAFEDLAALRLVELEERLGHAAEARLAGTTEKPGEVGAPPATNGDNPLHGFRVPGPTTNLPS
jgi:hypothetical protein